MVIMTWTESPEESVYTFVNGIPTVYGGTHEAGLKSAIVKAVRNYINVHDLTPKGLTITAEDTREGIVAVLSLYLKEPQFQGQTKERLNNAEVTPVLDAILRAAASRRWMTSTAAGGPCACAIAATVSRRP
mgnify:CR=1 FL=1